MNFPTELHYTKSHEWAGRTEEKVRVGITDYAQKEISDVVFIELPKVGQTVTGGKPCAVVESVKAAFDIYAPISGKISAVNSTVENQPELANRDCYGQGWFFEIESTAPDEWAALMTSDQYMQHIKQEA